MLAWVSLFWGIMSLALPALDNLKVNSKMFIFDIVIGCVLLVWFPLFMIASIISSEKQADKQVDNKEKHATMTSG